MRKLIFLLLFSLTLQAVELSLPAKEFLALFDIDPNQPTGHLSSYLQENWLQAKKERWEMEGRFEEKRSDALPYLKALGYIDTIHATHTHYTYALVLGAMGKTMQRRLDFLYEEWKRGVYFDEIVLLTGDRDLDPALESYPEGLRSETDLFVHLFNQHPLSEVVPHHVIDSPKELGRRPNTASTVRDWLATNPKQGSCLAISTQPFVQYQEAVIKFFLPNGFTVECIGPGTEGTYPLADLDLENAPPISYPMAIYLDSFAKWLLYEHLRELQ